MDQTATNRPGKKGDTAAAYFSTHDLREMFSRDNTERRRAGGHTHRRYLDKNQDKMVMSQMVKIREEFDVRNNNDVVIVWVQQQVAAGKAEGLHEFLLEVAEQTVIPKRAEPFVNGA